MLLQHEEGAEHGANAAGIARVRGAPVGTSQAGDNQGQIRARLQLMGDADLHQLLPADKLFSPHNHWSCTGCSCLPQQLVQELRGAGGHRPGEQASLFMQERRLYSHVNGKDAEQVVQNTHT